MLKGKMSILALVIGGISAFAGLAFFNRQFNLERLVSPNKPEPFRLLIQPAKPPYLLEKMAMQKSFIT